MTYDVFYYRDLAMTKKEAGFDRDIDRDRLERKLKTLVTAKAVAHCVPKTLGSPEFWFYLGRLQGCPPAESNR
jgi:hypothetical protein